jgi:glucose/arabinose dehydrogenase
VGAPGEVCLNAPQYGCDSAVISEFAVLGDPATSNVADPTSERVLLRVDKPQFNHNGGQIAFGPDGLLYASLGDGGGANDGLADVPPTHGPIGNGQNVEALLGKILRIDVEGTPDPGLAYRIPLGNPFVGLPGADEIYAYGFRNPYRFSFDDRAGGNDALYVGDVGQDLEEEVDVVVRGGNYGWALREGSLCFDPVLPQSPPATCPTTGLGGEPLLGPVLAYAHTIGLAVIGGYVYRGAALPALRGRYVFGDFSGDFGPTGQLFHTAVSGGDAFNRKEFQLPGDVPLGLYLLGIGQDQAGELYALVSSSLGPTGTTGRVFRISPP